MPLSAISGPSEVETAIHVLLQTRVKKHYVVTRVDCSSDVKHLIRLMAGLTFVIPRPFKVEIDCSADVHQLEFSFLQL